MDVLSRSRNRVLGWWYDVPLPAFKANETPIFQSWHRFDPCSNGWVPFDWAHVTAREERGASEDIGLARDLRLDLVTWNVDATASAPEARISAIISHLQNSVSSADLIFLQEVSGPALSTLLAIPWLRDHWYSSEADTTNWGSQSFATVTLVSKSRLGAPGSAANKVALGPIWRVKYPSRFGRDALCCDILLPSPGPAQSRSRFLSSTSTMAPITATSSSVSPQSLSHKYLSRIRLINVHLDSLPILPSLRPLQLSTIASYLCAAGGGLVAGDFNSVLPEDDKLISANRLVDAWTELHPSEAGFTWGLDGNQPFPPNRLDKVAVVGLKAYDIQVIPPGICMDTSSQKREQQATAPLPKQKQEQRHDHDSTLFWSDHSGLSCSFGLECT